MSHLYTTCPYCYAKAVDVTHLPGGRKVRKYHCGTTVMHVPGVVDRYDKRCP